MEVKLKINKPVIPRKVDLYEALGFEFYRSGLFPHNYEVKKCPYIKINTIEELIAFINKYGEIKISDDIIDDCFIITIINP